MFPAFVGVAFQVLNIYYSDFSRPENECFALFLSLWAVFMLGSWDRKEKEIALRWGTLGYDLEKEEVIRAEFTGEVINGYIDGSPMIHFNPTFAYRLIVCTFTVVVFACAIMVGSVLGIYVLRKLLFSTTIVSKFAHFAVSAGHAVFIVLCNYLIQFFAKWLTNIENQRTEAAFEDSLSGTCYRV